MLLNRNIPILYTWLHKIAYIYILHLPSSGSCNWKHILEECQSWGSEVNDGGHDSLGQGECHGQNKMGVDTMDTMNNVYLEMHKT